MRESTELKETILREAEELFMAHGYAGTSIKQIATASGCTTAALYYYFPEGKTQILREVVQCSFPAETVSMAIEAGRSATTLGEWLRVFGRAAMLSILEMQRRISWIVLESHQLGSTELVALDQHALSVNQTIAKEITRFVSDETKAQQLAWLLMCAVFGYGQLFLSRGTQQVTGLDIDTFVETLAWTIGKAAD
jgi:AcrR family transcriptional regulator